MDDNVRELDASNFDEAIRESDKLVIVEFYNTTCANCRAIAPTYSELSMELEKEAVFTKINAQQNPSIAARFGIMGVPTFKFLCQDRPIGEIVGSVHATMLRNTIKDMVRHRTECISKSTRLTFELDGYG
jgi:thioredoxin 1